MREPNNISSQKQIVERGTFIIKEDFNKYIKGYIIAKYNGKHIDTNSALESANKISQVFDLKFISNGNEIYDNQPNYKVYEKSPFLLKLFQCSREVKIEINNNEGEEVVEKYTITSENIELLSSFEGKNQNPYQGLFHQREEKEEFGTFKGDALLTYKHTKNYKYTVKIDSFLDKEISIYDNEANLVDTLVCDYEPVHLYTYYGQLFLHTKEVDFKILFVDKKLHLIEISTELITQEDLPEKNPKELINEPIVKGIAKKEPYSGKLKGGGFIVKFFETIGLLIAVLIYGFQILFFLWMFFQLFYEFPSLLMIVGFISLIALLNWLLPRVINSVFIPIGNLLLKIFTPLIAIVFIGWLVVSLFSILPDLKSNESRSFNYSEDSAKENKETVYDNYDEMIRINRIWDDYEGNEYEVTFEITLSDVNRSKALKSSVIGKFEYQKESEIYSQLFDNEKLYLANMLLELDSIRDTNNLTKTEFANVLMSFVQDIPYALVLQADCDISNYMDDVFVYNYLSEGGKCIGYEKFGVLTPTEFIYNTNGDCDTRTIFSHLIFKHFGYEVAIFNSNVYAHSIFGIHLDSNNIKGAFKLIKDKKYFLWETTSKGFKIGEIPSEIGNLNYWYQVLN